jgi:hypothetical protein
MRAVPDASAVRIYEDIPDSFPAPTRSAMATGNYNAIPSAWPNLVNPHTGKPACVVMSIRTLVKPLLTGQLDAMLAPLKRTAPHIAHCDYLTIWHEINAPARPYPASVRVPYNFRRMIRYLMSYFKGSYISVGVIVAGPTNKATKYLVHGEGWEGNDVYQFGSEWDQQRHLINRLNHDLHSTQASTDEKCPVFIIAETNAGTDWRRPSWFEWIAQWFARHDKCAPYRAVLTYWRYRPKPAGKRPISGPWSSASPTTRNVLETLARDESS